MSNTHGSILAGEHLVGDTDRDIDRRHGRRLGPGPEKHRIVIRISTGDSMR